MVTVLYVSFEIPEVRIKKVKCSEENWPTIGYLTKPESNPSLTFDHFFH